jgi:hypothetical protein
VALLGSEEAVKEYIEGKQEELVDDSTHDGQKEFLTDEEARPLQARAGKTVQASGR